MSSSKFFEINAVNEIHNGHFGTYLEFLLDEEAYRSGKGKDSFYKSDAKIAIKLGMTRRTIIKYRALAEELKLCFVSLSDFGYCQYRIYTDKISAFLKSGYELYMQRIRNQKMAHGIRIEKKKAWEDLVKSTNELVFKRCEMNSQGVCNQFTPYCSSNTVDLNNNNNSSVVVSVMSPSEEAFISDSTKLVISDNLDPKLFPIELVKPLAEELIKEFKKDETARKRYLDVGPDVGKWMVWNTALKMRGGKTLEDAVGGTVMLVTNKNYKFSKPRTLTEYEKEMAKKEKEKQRIQNSYRSFDSNTLIDFEAKDKQNLQALRSLLV